MKIISLPFDFHGWQRQHFLPNRRCGRLSHTGGSARCGRSTLANFEGWVIETLAQRLPADARAWFYRSHQGAEIDLLIERGGRPQIAIEIKRSSAPSPGKGFAQACDDLGVTQRCLVYPGTERYPLRHGAQALGVVELAGLLGAL